MLILIQSGHVTQKLTQHKRILGVSGARRRYAYRVKAKIRHAQITQENPAVGMRIGPHPPVALRREFGQFRYQAAIFIEQFLSLVTLHPTFKLRHMIGVPGIHDERHLMRSEGALDLEAIDDFRSRPALGDLRTIMGQRGRTASFVFRAFFWICRISSMASSMVAAMS